MIKHIVCFKLAENSTSQCQKAAEILRSMEGNVPQIKAIEVGIDTLHSARSYDIILQVTLDDMDSLSAYQSDPYHCSVVKEHMHAVAQSSIAIDYNI